MPCTECNKAREGPMYRMFSLTCVHCGARMIQVIGQYQIPVSEATARRRVVLRDWVAWGHSEEEIRRLAKGPMALAPGQEEVTVSEVQKSTRSR